MRHSLPNALLLGGLLVCGLGLASSSAFAITSAVRDDFPLTTLPGDPTRYYTRMRQEQADQAFTEGDYERSYRVYRKKLVPKGDKHAQFMLAYHHEHGLGVPKDLPRAQAWYVLAAERGADSAQARAEQLSERLSGTDQQRAEEIQNDLFERFGDQVLLRRALRRDQRTLRSRTGSYLGANVKPMRVLTGWGTVTGDTYYDLLEARIQLRLAWLNGTVTLGDLEVIEPRNEDAETTE